MQLYNMQCRDWQCILYSCLIRNKWSTWWWPQERPKHVVVPKIRYWIKHLSNNTFTVVFYITVPVFIAARSATEMTDLEVHFGTQKNSLLVPTVCHDPCSMPYNWLMLYRLQYCSKLVKYERNDRKTEGGRIRDVNMEGAVTLTARQCYCTCEVTVRRVAVAFVTVEKQWAGLLHILSVCL